MARRLVSAVLVATMLATSTGCYSTWDVPHQQLRQLHGYRTPEKRKVLNDDGDTAFVFDQRAELKFYAGPEKGRALVESGHFIAVDLEGATLFVGTKERDAALFERAPEGPKVRVDLTKITQVEATRYSAGKTAGLAVGVVLGTLLVAGSLVVAIGLATKH